MNNADHIGYIKIAAGSAVLALIAGLGWWVASIQPVFDDQLCRIDMPLPGHLMILTDLSDADDSEIMANMVRNWKAELPIYHKLSVYRIGDITVERDSRDIPSTWPLVPVFEACNPGRAEQVNALIRGTRVAQKKYDLLFDEPLDHAVTEAAVQAGTQSSPILAALGRIPDVPRWTESTQRTLMIRSDFLEFTPQYSQYRTIDDLETTLEAAGAVMPGLKGVDLTVIYVTREKYVPFQSEAHVGFWDEYFKNTKATLSMMTVDEHTVPSQDGDEPRRQSLAAL